MTGSLARQFQLQDCCQECGRPFEGSADKHGVVLSAGSIAFHGANVRLTTREVEIVRVLLKAAPSLVAKEHLFLSVWECDRDMKLLEVYVCKIRKKLKAIGLSIDTSWGRGYTLVIP